MADLFAITVSVRYYLLAANEQEATAQAREIYKERGPEASCFSDPDIDVYRTPNQDFALKTRAANFCDHAPKD